jgi:hypothetical protein
VKTRHISRSVGEFETALIRFLSNVRRTHDLGSYHSQEKGTSGRDVCALEYLANEGQMTHEVRADGELTSFRQARPTG